MEQNCSLQPLSAGIFWPDAKTLFSAISAAWRRRTRQPTVCRRQCLSERDNKEFLRRMHRPCRSHDSDAPLQPKRPLAACPGCERHIPSDSRPSMGTGTLARLLRELLYWKLHARVADLEEKVFGAVGIRVARSTSDPLVRTRCIKS